MRGETEKSAEEVNRKPKSFFEDLEDPGHQGSSQVREIVRSLLIFLAILLVTMIWFSQFLFTDSCDPNALAIRDREAVAGPVSIGPMIDRMSIQLLLAVIVYSVYTDLKFGKILNLVTYPSALIILGSKWLCSIICMIPIWSLAPLMWISCTLLGDFNLRSQIIQVEPCSDLVITSLAGGFLCFAIMFFSFLTAGGGGGDVKLGTLIGLALGPKTGAFALMYSYLSAGAYLCGVFMIWQLVDSLKSWRGIGLTMESSGAAPAVVRVKKSNGWFGRRGIWLRMSPFFLIGTLAAIAETFIGGAM